ncbi:ABC transporter permease [Actinomadura roseirufa]|uniref:ABC transporter permease n=1 Tax=Actinomadura roseirufa TaxID=2094049 RepID=UPI001040F42C|nr:ABC transporter permease [Actinomadura roseirufa]
MRPSAVALRTGWNRGRIELRQSFTNGAELFSHLLWPVLMVAVLYFMGDRAFRSSGLQLGALALPGILGMNAAMGMIGMSQQLAADREDGTLLRAKATPNGMVGYLTGKVVSVAGGLAADLLIFLVPALLVIGGLPAGGPGDWATLAWVLPLGLAATLPAGAILGSLLPGARGQGLLQLVSLGVIALSGVFYPVTALPEWSRWIAQASPVYWLGLGTRAALLPDAAAGVEIGGSWRPAQTACALAVWAVAGLVAAPPVLRRMARRESGSKVAERRAKALRRAA